MVVAYAALKLGVGVVCHVDTAIASHMVVAYAASTLGVGLVQGMDTAIASHMVVGSGGSATNLYSDHET